MSVQKGRKYDSDFKRNAVLLSMKQGKTVCGNILSKISQGCGVFRKRPG